ncbi:MAG: methionine--tRNA ligase [Candidatus Omnitrophica bacterium]|nr:methionine--tRNA ligase [Candidatus Omnitrophota bacterium]
MAGGRRGRHPGAGIRGPRPRRGRGVPGGGRGLVPRCAERLRGGGGPGGIPGGAGPAAGPGRRLVGRRVAGGDRAGLRDARADPTARQPAHRVGGAHRPPGPAGRGGPMTRPGPKPYYVTTPLYYVNAPPHLGHAYTTVIADVLARYQRLRRGAAGVWFLTGTDEHGQKIQQAAAAAGQSPQAFADAIVPNFQNLWAALNISYDDFIRTTEPRHRQSVQAALTRLFQQGQIVKDHYEGWYCTPCETFWPKLVFAGPGGQPAAPVCPDCRRPVEQITEENYFFPLEPHRRWLVDHIRAQETFILPATRRNEVLAFLEQPLTPLCISRPTARLSWGIPLPSPPFEPGYVTYVWFDALLNYITAVGYPTVDARWPADAHLIGKDILRPHAVYWPIMLRALGLPPPATIAVHGWWLVEGEKMSKSKGNVVDPNVVVGEFGVDAYRYFLLREIPFGQDGTFSEAALERRYTDDLANDLGNLVYRMLTMVEKYFNGVLPLCPSVAPGLRGELIGRAIEACDFQAALNAIWQTVTEANMLVDKRKPWVLVKGGAAEKQQLAETMGTLANSLRAVAVWLWPFMPATSENIWRQLGCPGVPSDVEWDMAWTSRMADDQRIQKSPPLFPRRS